MSSLRCENNWKTSPLLSVDTGCRQLAQRQPRRKTSKWQKFHVERRKSSGSKHCSLEIVELRAFLLFIQNKHAESDFTRNRLIFLSSVYTLHKAKFPPRQKRSNCRCFRTLELKQFHRTVFLAKMKFQFLRFPSQCKFFVGI